MTQMKCENELSFIGPYTTNLEITHGTAAGSREVTPAQELIMAERTLEETYVVYFRKLEPKFFHLSGRNYDLQI